MYPPSLSQPPNFSIVCHDVLRISGIAIHRERHAISTFANNAVVRWRMKQARTPAQRAMEARNRLEMASPNSIPSPVRVTGA